MQGRIINLLTVGKLDTTFTYLEDGGVTISFLDIETGDQEIILVQPEELNTSSTAAVSLGTQSSIDQASTSDRIIRTQYSSASTSDLVLDNIADQQASCSNVPGVPGRVRITSDLACPALVKSLQVTAIETDGEMRTRKLYVCPPLGNNLFEYRLPTVSDEADPGLLVEALSSPIILPAVCTGLALGAGVLAATAGLITGPFAVVASPAAGRVVSAAFGIACSIAQEEIKQALIEQTFFSPSQITVTVQGNSGLEKSETLQNIKGILPPPEVEIEFSDTLIVSPIQVSNPNPAPGVSYSFSAEACVPPQGQLRLFISGTDGFSSSRSFPNGSDSSVSRVAGTLNVPGAATGVRDTLTATGLAPNGTSFDEKKAFVVFGG